MKNSVNRGGNDMDQQKHELINTIREIEFAAIELQLYLDTHPCDQRAIIDYNGYVQQLELTKRSYEAKFGSLLNFGNAPSQLYAWQWADDLWPWDMEK